MGSGLTTADAALAGSKSSLSGCLLMHHRELNHKAHTWGASDEFCREFGPNTRQPQTIIIIIIMLMVAWH